MGLINLLERLKELRKTLSSLLKDAGEQPDEEIHRGKSGRVPSAGASVPVELGCITLPVWMCSLTWKLSESHAFGILWKLPYVGLIEFYSISSPSPLFREVEVRAGLKFLVMVWSFC